VWRPLKWVQRKDPESRVVLLAVACSPEFHLGYCSFISCANPLILVHEQRLPDFFHLIDHSSTSFSFLALSPLPSIHPYNFFLVVVVVMMLVVVVQTLLSMITRSHAPTRLPENLGRGELNKIKSHFQYWSATGNRLFND
jgi:hypothetical protein